jgi:hypothetical protein
MDKVPGTELILYQFQPNSSQKMERMSNKKDWLYFNLNFLMPSQSNIG